MQCFGEIDGKATFRTNIPGIVYTLAFYPDGNGVTAQFPQSNEFYLTGNDHDNEDAVKEKHGTFVWSSGRQTDSPVFPTTKTS